MTRTLLPIARPSTRDVASRRDEGTAILEFAFVGVLFATLLFGIINMGVLLSFKQNLTQAASEAARASVAVVSDGSGTDERYDAVDAALDDVLADHDRQCGASGVTCLRKISDCTDADGTPFASIPEDTSASDACMTVRIEFDNTGSNRIMPSIPLVSALEPDSMSAQTTVRLVPVSATP